MRRLLGAIPPKGLFVVKILSILSLVSLLSPYEFLVFFLPSPVEGYNPPFQVVVSAVCSFVVVIVESLRNLNSHKQFKYFLSRRSVLMIDGCMASAYLRLREFVTLPL